METIATDEQIDFCYTEANKIAKILMDKNVENIFGENGGNCLFVLETLTILIAGSIESIAHKIDYKPENLLDLFSKRVKNLMKIHRKNRIYNNFLVQ